jgi:hypothetical protein
MPIRGEINWRQDLNSLRAYIDIIVDNESIVLTSLYARSDNAVAADRDIIEGSLSLKKRVHNDGNNNQYAIIEEEMVVPLKKDTYYIVLAF